MNKKRSIYLMYAIALLQGMVFYGPVATLYRQAQGVSLFQITIIEGISLALMILLEIPWGYVADKIGYKKTMIICNTLYFVSKIVFWKAAGFAWFLAERLLLSVVLSGLSGCDSAYLFAAAGQKDSHKIFGIYSATSTTGLIVASIVFSTVVLDNYPLSGFLTVISYGLSMLLTIFLQDTGANERRNNGLKESVREIVSALKRNKHFFVFLLAATLLVESNQTITVFLSQIQYLRAGIQPKYMGYLYILLTISGILSAFSSKLTGRLGETKICRMLFAAAGISCAAAAVTFNPVLSVFFLVLLRVSASLFVPVNMKIQNRQIRIADRATMLSVYSSTMNIGAIFTNIIFGKLADIHVGFALGAGAVFCCTGLLLYTIWAKKAQ